MRGTRGFPKLVESAPVQPPPDRGRLLTADEIAEEIFRSKVSAWWVRKNVAPAKKVVLGHSTVMWYEHDVREWVDSRRGAGTHG